jgi:spermidine synthase
MLTPMPDSSPSTPERSIAPLGALVLTSGLAGLSWEVLWQHHAGLALGISAQGAALTLACTMGGMALGSLWMGRRLNRRPPSHPLRLYAALEAVVGLAGLWLAPGFVLLERFDVAVYHAVPVLAPLLRTLGIVALLGPPTVAMGATLPTFRLLSDARRAPLSLLYGLNTSGAALGTLGSAFVLIPRLGVFATGLTTVCLDLAVAVGALVLSTRSDSAPPRAEILARQPSAEVAIGSGGDEPPVLSRNAARIAVVLTGIASFVLEVAWFRSLRAAFQSTTDGFAVMLAAVLVPLALGARLATKVPRKSSALGMLLAVAGLGALLANPLVERLDLLRGLYDAHSFAVLQLGRLAVGALVVCPAMLPLGAALPWVLDRERDPGEVGVLYGLNTMGAVVGSLSAGWLLLPVGGAVKAAWLASGLLLAAALPFLDGRGRVLVLGSGSVGLALAAQLQSGLGWARVQGAGSMQVVAYAEGPDATVSVVEAEGRVRHLFIDGFETTSESLGGHYMAWMGRLPMLLHPRPERALVICFGTGQTANGVRREGPTSLDVVDLSPAVLSMAPLFATNEQVLEDPRVRTVVMDGRAWMRRTDTDYDVITLEPMDPHFAGTNALYDLEFYRLAEARLRPGGVLAQWVPLHILAPLDAASITRTFLEVFPESLLWVDPVDGTAILLGRKPGPGLGPWPTWYGLDRASPGRNLSPEAIREVALQGAALRRYADEGMLVTDDNQLLSYGPGRRAMIEQHDHEKLWKDNLDHLRALAAAH